MVMASAFASIAVSVIVVASKVVVALSRVQDFHLDQVKNETHDSNDEHEVSFNLRRLEESHGGLTEKPDSHDPDA